MVEDNIILLSDTTIKAITEDPVRHHHGENETERDTDEKKYPENLLTTDTTPISARENAKEIADVGTVMLAATDLVLVRIGHVIDLFER